MRDKFNMIKVYNFCNVFIGDGGELFVKEFEVSEESSFDDVWCLMVMLEIGEEKKYGEWKEGDCKEEWEGVFDYNGNVIDDSEMEEYEKEFNELKVKFLSKRNNEKLLRSGVEYDDNMIFVENDKIDEVVEILEKIKLINDEKERLEFGY